MPWKRRQLLRRARASAGQLKSLQDRTGLIPEDAVLCFSVMRNERPRLSEFLDHYRKIGVAHFLILDNRSTDGTAAYLRDQPDVSLWRAEGGYRDSRFGMDWLNHLLAHRGHDHWCLIVDADELLIYPDWEERSLSEVTAYLEGQGLAAMGALMLDLYPSGPLGTADAPASTPLAARLPWFDARPYRCEIQAPKRNRWVQGGVRERAFFADRPSRSPTLNKLPLIRWDRSYAYVNSTHSLLPRRLNDCYDGPGDHRLSGVLLHGKFLPDIVVRSSEELSRRQHFADPDAYVGYHQAIVQAPVLRAEASVRLTNWRQLVDLDLMGVGSLLD